MLSKSLIPFSVDGWGCVPSLIFDLRPVMVQVMRITVETVSDFIFWAPKSLQMVIAAVKLKDACSLEGKL